jgi:hypothetical protein
MKTFLTQDTVHLSFDSLSQSDVWERHITSFVKTFSFSVLYQSVFMLLLAFLKVNKQNSHFATSFLNLTKNRAIWTVTEATPTKVRFPTNIFLAKLHSYADEWSDVLAQNKCFPI